MQRWRKSQKGRVCKMRYHNITKDDMLNGDGLRVVLWVAGCSHCCKDPLHVRNAYDVKELAKEIREKFPQKTIWLYTGSLWEEIKNTEIVKYLDVLVDGEFECDKKDVSLHWKGSANQRVIDVQESLRQEKVILHDS